MKYYRLKTGLILALNFTLILNSMEGPVTRTIRKSAEDYNSNSKLKQALAKIESFAKLIHSVVDASSVFRIDEKDINLVNIINKFGDVLINDFIKLNEKEKVIFLFGFIEKFKSMPGSLNKIWLKLVKKFIVYGERTQADFLESRHELMSDTFLIEATKLKSEEMIKLFLDFNININARNINGWTSLMYAAKFNLKNIVDILIKYGARVDELDNIEETALFKAIDSSSSEEILDLLLENSSDINNVNIINKNGETPLIKAVLSGSLVVVKKLISYGAKVAVVDDYNRTLLMLSIIKGYKDIAKLLLSCDLNNLNNQDNNGNTVLHIAVVKGYTDIIELLLACNNINSNIKNNNKLTPLELTADENIRKLLEKHKNN